MSSSHLLFISFIKTNPKVQMEEMLKKQNQIICNYCPQQERERMCLIHHYHHAFRGFSAMLTQNEASELSSKSALFLFLFAF
ncbi:Proteinase inhibitor I9 [Corchorus olitorius]|uniref:Proteinase inhibitor I9 n=1 Tax=Corchorus olitorius TaxID=93759 RepID=A0A1R3G1J3_9ROSI|nr:Proteinase inhibitor I9 [Corchorus olitorius]